MSAAIDAAISAVIVGFDDDAPEAPSREVCVRLLAELARAVEQGGFASFVREPIAIGAAAIDDVQLGRGASWAAYAGLGAVALERGRCDLDELAFLVAVQSIVRDDEPSYELGDEQRARAWAWHVALIGLDDELRAALAIPPPADWPE